MHFDGMEIMNTKELLKKLSQVPGIAGEERAATELAAQFLKEYTSAVRINPLGSVIAEIKAPDAGAPTLLLDAHIDQIGLIVTHIEENGFLRVGSCGGIDRRLLLAQRVTIFGKRPVMGIVASKPPHLQNGDEAKKVPEIDGIFIDTGCSSEELKSLVSPGDKVRIEGDFLELKNQRVAGPALDDRAGVAAVLLALEYLKQKHYPCGLTVVFSTQEETGSAGAATSAYAVGADMAVAVDVSFAYTSDAPEHKCGKMGQGVMIGVAPVLDKRMSDALILAAKERKIPYQVEVMSGSTGTNADKIAVSRSGVRTGVLSIPQKYMHTPVEVVQTEDVESTAALLAEFVLRAGEWNV